MGDARDKEPPIRGGKLGRGDYDRLGQTLTREIEHQTAIIHQKVDLKMDGIEKQLLAKLDGTKTAIDGKPGHGVMIAHTVAIIGLLAALLLGVLTLAGDKFNAGMSVTGIMSQQEVERARREADLDDRMRRIENALIEMREERREPQRALPNASQR